MIQKTTTLNKPRLPEQQVLTKVSMDLLEDELELVNFELDDANFHNQQVKHISLECGRLRKISLIGVCLIKPKIKDIYFEKCDVSSGEWKESKINRVAITDSRLIGLRLQESQLSDVSINDCLGDMMQLFGSKCKNISFTNCRLKKADFRSCELENVAFYNCDLTEAEFYDAKLDNVDFSGSLLDSIKAGALDLKGAIIDTQQSIDMAAHLAKLLGIIVKRNQ